MSRWSLSISEETNLAVRTFLARKGGKKGDLSRFVDEAVRRRVLDRSSTNLEHSMRAVHLPKSHSPQGL